VRPDFWVVQTFNGLSYGALLFLLASGLSLIFGVMRIVNMAHGSYFMLGGYLGLTVALRTRSFAMAVVAGTVAIALIGMAMERVFLRRLRGQDLGQVLMTIGFALIFQDLALLIWGGDPYNLPVPARLSGALRLGGVGGPYALLLSADAFTAVSETSDHGYPVREHLRRLIDGPIVWAPAIDGAFVVTTRGGDFEMYLAQDLSIGYQSHDADSVHLYFIQALTFLVHTAEAAVPLTAG